MLRKSLFCLLILPAIAAYLYYRDPASTDTGEYVIENSIEPVRRMPPLPAELSRLEKLEAQAKDNPVEFLEECLAEYQRTVQGYRLTFLKQECVKGKMGPKETIKVHFREKPFSVHMDWVEGKGKAARTLFVEGENDDRLVARPLLFNRESPILFERRVDDPDAMATSRFPITRFGIYKGQESTLAAIKAAQKAGTLHLRYEGIEPLKEVGNRPCFKFARYKYDPPEDDGICHFTFYVDQDSLLQVGSILRGEKMDLIAEYFFRDIVPNPTFDEKQFTRKAL